jgi:hypothetical protein
MDDDGNLLVSAVIGFAAYGAFDAIRRTAKSFLERRRASSERSMSDLSPLPDTPPGRYRHYKGGEYEVIGAARHSETLEPLVVYRPLYNDSGLWARPHRMFFEQVEVAGKRQPRFVRIEGASDES